MPHPLESRLAEIRRGIRQVLVTYGLSWVAAVALGSVLLVCSTDWLFHLDDPGVRLILGLGVLGVSGWVVFRYLFVPLRTSFQDLDLALRIEERYPGFKDSLASTVQFLHGHADPAIGSPAMQRAVIERTLSQVERIEFSDVIETRGVRKVAAAAVGVCLATALTVGLNQSETAIALQRLMFPFSAPAWPRKTNLRVLNADLEPLEFDAEDPLRIARGDTLKLFVENMAGRLPSKVNLEYRFADDKVVSEPLRGTTLRDRQGEARELAAGQLVAMKGPLWFRAVGGDCLGTWYEVHVVPPPVVEMLQVVLTPPAYCKRPVERLPEGVGHVQGLIGTRVAIEAQVSKPLRSAAVRVRDQERYPAKLSADGRRVSASFVIKDSGIYSYWFDLQDSQGFENNEASRYEVRGIQDLVPDIYIDVPSSDMQATAEAEVSVRTVAKDDLGLKEIRLVHRNGDAPLNDKVTEKDKVKAKSISLFDGKGRPQQQTVEYKWNLADLKPQSGARIVFHTEATDDYDVALGLPEHVGRSISRTITIVSREEKSQELAQRQAGLLEDLERSFKLQDQARTQVSELQLQLQNAGKLRPQDVDALQRVELSQRQVGAQLTGQGDGLERRARGLLDELRDNKLQDVETERRMSRLADELKRIGEENLPTIEQDLTLARKLAQAGPDQGTQPASKRPSSDPSKPGTGATQENLKPASAPKSTTNAPSESAGKSPASAGADTTKPAVPESARKPNGSAPSTPEKQGPAEDKPTVAKKDAGDSKAPDESPAPIESKATNAPSESQAADRGKTAADRATAEKSPARTSTGRKPPVPQPVSQSESLKQVAENQSAVLESLSELLQQLSEWRNQRSTVQELAEIVEGQEEVNKQTAELGKQTLTKPKEDLSPQDEADLKRMAARQQKQAERFDQLSAKMQSTIDQARAEDPAAAATLEDALTQAQQEAISGQMREATSRIEGNKMGEAAQAQQQILQKLREMEDVLRNNQETDSENLVKKLKAAEQTLDDLRKRQAELLRKVRDAEKLTDPEERKSELQKLKKEQQQLQDELAKESRRLQRLQAHKPGKASRRAAAKMQQAQEAMEQGDAGTAAEEQEESLDALEQAQRELAKERRTAEEQLAREQLAKIADELKAMIPREQAIIDETRRLNDLRAGGNDWTRAQLRTLRDLAETQRGLKQETDKLVETLTAAEVFSLALKGAARNMQRAGDFLGEKNTGEATQKEEISARQRFVTLIEALKPEKKKQGKGAKQPEGGAGGGDGGDEGPETDGIPLLAELKLLKAMQEELNERTIELAKVKDAGPLTPVQEQELESVAREQGVLADMTRNLTKLLSQSDAEEGDGAQDGAPDDGAAPERGRENRGATEKEKKNDPLPDEESGPPSKSEEP